MSQLMFTVHYSSAVTQLSIFYNSMFTSGTVMAQRPPAEFLLLPT